MSIPSDPTVTSVVTEGLKRAGRTTPTPTMITDAITHQFQEVKSDIRMIAPCHESLKTEAYTTLVKGMREYAWPTDAHKIACISCVDASDADGWIGTAQAGSTTTVTLASTLDLSEEEMLGRRVFTTGGTGAGQAGYIIGWDNTTKIATLGATLTTGLNSTTTYLVERTSWKVWDDMNALAVYGLAPYSSYGPYRGSMMGRKIVLHSSPPRTAILVWHYWAALDRLDEAGVVFVRHLREYRSLWLQGVDVKTCQRYDEDRYATEFKVYDSMLNGYGGLACNVTEGTFTDV